MTEERNNKNTKAFGIGFFLILLVVGFTFFRNSFESKKEYDREVAKIEGQKIEAEKEITPEVLSRKILNNEKIIIVDIRPAEQYAKEHLAESVNIPPSSFAAEIKKLDAQKTLVVVDSSDTPESRLLFKNFFLDNGFSNSFYLTGGLTNWKRSYNPTISEGNPASFTDQAKVTFISSDELKKKIETEGNNLQLIDVRPLEDFAAGHLKEAANLPLETLEKNLDRLRIGKTIVLYDDFGILAFKAAVKLFDLGYFNTLTLSDGLDAWKQKGFEVIK